MTGSWNAVHRWINHGRKKMEAVLVVLHFILLEQQGDGTCWNYSCRCVDCVVFSCKKPWRKHRSKYQSLAHGIFIFSLTWDCVGVTPHWCIGSDCSWALTARRAISEEIILPWGWIYLKLYHLKKEGYVAFRSVSPLNSLYTCMCLARLEWTELSHTPGLCCVKSN